ncbi:MAG: 2-dehydro-3-deoxyglucarate aldolase [Verrucomicrobia bacterium]|nr:2-dehydro-3-deoxyglucarate aldolase [Verrucomicrobiota bacterium]MBI3868171.1 2-dehydro-3-deoxyglucarate aldolase [Verrucomicrobiota bacterium]
MKKNFVRAKLKQGQPSVGTWLNLPDAAVASLMSRVGFDWLTIELEHSPTTYETAVASFSILAGNGVVPLVRVSYNTPENIKRVLDFGAWGVIVPMVNTRAEAEAVVAAARYGPEGARTIGGQFHAANFDTDAATYYDKANEEILVVVMAEHVQAIENAEEILQTPGIDVVFIGPNDLTKSMGLAPVFETEDPRFVAAVEKILKLAKKHGVAPGIHVADAAAARKRLAQGFQFVAIGSEVGMMLSKASETVKEAGVSTTKGPLARY